MNVDTLLAFRKCPRCHCAWGKKNSKLRNLATADYGERESNLFGPGFLEKAPKRVEPWPKCLGPANARLPKSPGTIVTSLT